MRFRLKALGLHLLASAVALTLVLGTLYLGWYRWPGWYLADALQVVTVLAGVDLAVGPVLTFVIARASKPRRDTTRDVGAGKSFPRQDHHGHSLWLSGTLAASGGELTLSHGDSFIDDWMPWGDLCQRAASLRRYWMMTAAFYACG
jgi:hypothetical protein